MHIYNGPTNALVCNKTIQMSHIKTLKITPGQNLRLQVWLCGSIRSFVLYVVLCRGACRHVDMPLHTRQHAKRMNICYHITILEDSNFNQ
jgi:hypothetical protein